MIRNGRLVNKETGVPSVPHWAILWFTTIHISGDERSVSNPGHGYPAHNETSVNYYVFTNREDWETEIQRLEKGKYTERFRAMYVCPASISTEVNVSVEIKDY